MLHGHGNYLVCFVAIGDELNGLPFRLRVLNELFEPSSLDEEFNSIFQVDAIKILCQWYLWNRQYLVLSTPFRSFDGAFGGLTRAFVRSATEISARIFSPDMAKGVYSLKRLLGPLPSRFTLPSFFFSWKGFLEDSTAGSSFLDLLRLSAYSSSSYLM